MKPESRQFWETAQPLTHGVLSAAECGSFSILRTYPSPWRKSPCGGSPDLPESRNQTFSDSKSSDTELKLTWELEGEIRGPRARTVAPMSSMALLNQTSPTPSPLAILALVIRFRAGHPSAGSAASRRGLRPRSPCALGRPRGVAAAGRAT